MGESVSFQEQKKIYDILDELSVNEYSSEIELLKSAIQRVVDSSIFTITDGRLWVLDTDNQCYRLEYQYGNGRDIPTGYEISLQDDGARSSLLELSKKRSVIRKETDKTLIDSGINHYSLTGVGDMVKFSGRRYFRYALGFNGAELDSGFYDTISVISRVVGVALRHLEDDREITRQNKDLAQAAKIQENLFPDHQKHYLDYDIFGVCVPDSQVGGDYFDYITSTDRLGDEHLGIVISDASSKGLPAAIQSLFVSGALKMGMAFSSRISNTFAHLNNLIHDAFPFERFVTMFYMELTKSSNRLLLYANAGHCPPIRYKSATDEIKLLHPTGGLLGVAPDQRFDVENTRMSAGDVMLLYTDGISEAMDKHGKQFGVERLSEILREHRDKTSKEIAMVILEEVNLHLTDAPYTDDKTMIVIKREKKIS